MDGEMVSGMIFFLCCFCIHGEMVSDTISRTLVFGPRDVKSNCREFLRDDLLGRFVTWPTRNISVVFWLVCWSNAEGLTLNEHSLNVGSPV
jgi:hypothetical protein